MKDEEGRVKREDRKEKIEVCRNFREKKDKRANKCLK
jgi:hypothetical protein